MKRQNREVLIKLNIHEVKKNSFRIHEQKRTQSYYTFRAAKLGLAQQHHTRQSNTTKHIHKHQDILLIQANIDIAQSRAGKFKALAPACLRVCEKYIQEQLPGVGLQPENGSPWKPGRQAHTGWWLTTVHCALNPQEPAHGSRHLLCTHASLVGQSAWMMHSGRQLGGAPSMPDRQEQTGRLSTTRHSALEPHGDGTHGFIGLIGVLGAEEIIHQYKVHQN